MVSSDIEICNMALAHAGVGERIDALDEASEAARACKLFYEDLRDKLLRRFRWPFALKLVALGLVAEDPNDEWGFSYAYPSDCLEARRILSGQRSETQGVAIPFRVAQDETQVRIFTDQEDAQLEYTKRETDVSRYPRDFMLALTYLLAASIAPMLGQNANQKLGVRAYQLYQAELADAMAAARREGQPDRPPESEFIRDRG